MSLRVSYITFGSGIMLQSTFYFIVSYYVNCKTTHLHIIISSCTCPCFGRPRVLAQVPASVVVPASGYFLSICGQVQYCVNIV